MNDYEEHERLRARIIETACAYMAGDARYLAERLATLALEYAGFDLGCMVAENNYDSRGSGDDCITTDFDMDLFEVYRIPVEVDGLSDSAREILERAFHKGLNG